ncbi:glutathione S-transferase C-terminal domain-containing protein-like [Pomacea canaliculata]|uniref:glutathione S-transferase C-terminal domain-containing protein-like n=1 Tax=Pomacea canaliculata TaxID=400727 RepID=UPI000D72B808|nr:glutathione S-transferase C-terminal domain-containing protein-like [Pomacea canaliculata]
MMDRSSSLQSDKMKVQVFLEGIHAADGEHILLPLSSCALLLIAHYCNSEQFSFVFVNNDKECSQYMPIPLRGMQRIEHKFTDLESIPQPVCRVLMPAVFDSSVNLVRSGLCVVARHMIRIADAISPNQHLKDLLGFREGSLRMCAEVSGWTKLCEVELPHSVTMLVHQISAAKLASENGNPIQVQFSGDLVKLEAHFAKPPRVHNDDRWRRDELTKLQADTKDDEKYLTLIKSVKVEKSLFSFEKVTILPHGCRKFRVEKDIAKELQLLEHTMLISMEQINMDEAKEKESSIWLNKQQVCSLIQSLTYQDIQLIHLYSEGVEMTLADICLFVYFYFLMEALSFDQSGLSNFLPRVLSWLHHMTSLPRLQAAAFACGLNIQGLKSGLEAQTSLVEGQAMVEFFRSNVEQVMENDMELSRRCRTKHKAIKPEVVEALNKVKRKGIEPIIGQHLRGHCVQLDWKAFPSAVHPREGEVPLKRVERKCQQLENLATAIQEVARPDDIIVDFCSGGGHLGIVVAYLLPQCKVCLVENKEESLMKARSRIESLNLTNIILYQCNLDYFVGKFDVGTCLHACGTATDMVLSLCLRNNAAFVICPCCYGSIQRTHLLSYPRSKLYQDCGVTYTEFLTLGHAADQTEFNIALEQQGRLCMNLVDFDRAQLAIESDYKVNLCSLQPLTCSPKNNLLIGQQLMCDQFGD